MWKKSFTTDGFKAIGTILILAGVLLLPVELKLKVLFGMGWIFWNSSLALKWEKNK